MGVNVFVRISMFVLPVLHTKKENETKANEKPNKEACFHFGRKYAKMGLLVCPPNGVY
jgi:hypothetical protein